MRPLLALLLAGCVLTDKLPDTGADTGGTVDLATKVIGDYLGSIRGPITEVAYPLTLEKVDTQTIRVKGADFAPFEVPLAPKGSGVVHHPDWEDGAFAYSSNHIELVYTPTDLTYIGDRL